MTFDAIDNHYRRRLVYFAEQIIKDREQAKDIVQEALIKLWQRFDGFENEKAVRSFAYMIVKNACFDYLRGLQSISKKQEGFYYIADTTEESIIFLMIETELLQELHNGIELLPKAERKIFRLMYFQNMNTKQVADKLGLSEKTVRNQRGKTINRLKLRMNI
jgi:RNA polymerase sigma-70 factor (family 1)